MIESIAAVFVAGSIPVARAVDMVALRARAYAHEHVRRRWIAMRALRSARRFPKRGHRGAQQ